jgi:hypothetical protein
MSPPAVLTLLPVIERRTPAPAPFAMAKSSPNRIAYSNRNQLDLVEGNLIGGPIIELDGAWTFLPAVAWGPRGRKRRDQSHGIVRQLSLSNAQQPALARRRTLRVLEHWHANEHNRLHRESRLCPSVAATSATQLVIHAAKPPGRGGHAGLAACCSAALLLSLSTRFSARPSFSSQTVTVDIVGSSVRSL